MPFDNRDDIIMVSAIIERMEELESEHETEEGESIPPAEWADTDAFDEWKTWRDLVEEIDANTNLDLESVTLIRHNYFQEYVKQECLDSGHEYQEYDPQQYKHVPVSLDTLLSREPFCFIDWKAVAEYHERHYYVTVSIDGVEYLHES